MERKGFAVIMAVILFVHFLPLSSGMHPKHISERGVILIHNIYELRNISKNLSGNYALANDIDASITRNWNGGAGFEPIGDSSDRPFKGTFDGRGHRILNLYINRPDERGVGLFGYVSEFAIIRNINLFNVSVRGEYDVGALAGVVNGEIYNCAMSGNVTGEGFYVGGLIGELYSGGWVEKCHSAGNVAGKWYVGGVVGYSEGFIVDSYANCNITGLATVGGLVGNNWGHVSNSHYNVDEVLINGGHFLTIGGLFGGQFYDWISNGLNLEIENYSSTLKPSGHYYLIDSVQGLKDLLGFSDRGYMFRLTADLNLSEYPNLYIPYFNGVFDGDNHTIYNLNINMTNLGHVGLFGYNSGTVKNLRIVSGNVTGIGEEISLLVAYNSGTVKNCNVSGKVFSKYGSYFDGGTYYVGGLVGYSEGSIVKCFSRVNVTGGEFVGGLAGFSSGQILKSGTFCYVRGYKYVGGLVGDNLGTIIKSFTNCNVVGKTYVGGLMGENSGLANESYSQGGVRGYEYVGGFAGFNQGYVYNDYSKSGVYGTRDVGGLVGRNFMGWEIRYSYSSGSVEGSYSVGGLVGFNENGIVNSSFWDVNKSGISKSDGGTGKTTDELRHKSTYVAYGWDFETVWDIIDGKDYPFFIWQERAPPPPINLKVQSYGTTVKLMWIPPAEEDHSPIKGYRIYRGISENAMILISVVNASENTYIDTNITPGERYFYFVTSYNFAGESTPSTVVNVTPQTGIHVPSAPEKSTVMVGLDYVNISWITPEKCSSKIIEYKVYRGEKAGEERLLAAVSANLTWYNDTLVDINRTYYYYVTAVNSAGESNESEEITVMFKVPPPPTNLTAFPRDCFVNLTWKMPLTDYYYPSVKEYRIYRNGSLIATVPANRTHYKDSSVVCGVKYTYYVTAVNSLGESERSDVVYAAPVLNLWMRIVPWALLSTAILIAILVGYVVKRRREK